MRNDFLQKLNLDKDCDKLQLIQDSLDVFISLVDNKSNVIVTNNSKLTVPELSRLA